jgi:hypothetical protein
MTNAAIEAGFVAISLGLGLFGAHPGFLGWSVCAALGWWLLVHEARLRQMFVEAKLKVFGSIVLAYIAILVVHSLAFGFGYILHEAMGPR